MAETARVAAENGRITLHSTLAGRIDEPFAEALARDPKVDLVPGEPMKGPKKRA